MKYKLYPIKIFFFALCISLLTWSCIEEVPLENNQQSTIDLAKILVVEASLTNLLETQIIKISRVAPLENDTLILKVPNAEVSVIDDNGQVFHFVQNTEGDYQSEFSFGVNENLGYQLQITTQDGMRFVSEPVVSEGPSTIDAIYATRMTSQSGIDGIAIYVDSRSPQGTTADFRYSWEETYKIVAPNWTAFEFEQTSELDPVAMTLPNVRLVPRAQQEQICFKSEQGQALSLSDGPLQEGNLRTRNQVVFLNNQNPKIAHRYSLLVNQRLMSASASRFYKTLQNFSENESLFSAVQPGLIEGNIKATNDEKALVIGFFEVSNVVTQRIFFNYSDFYPDTPLPPYFDGINCDRLIAPVLLNPIRDGIIPPNVSCGTPLLDLIDAEEIEFFSDNGVPPGECEGPYVVTLRPCGDCTAIGSNQRPDFWID